jgi:gluconolactonase
MAATETLTSAARVPGPPELLPGRPDAIIDLQTAEGLALASAEWRYADCAVREIDFVAVGSESDPLGPGDVPNRTYDIVPHAETLDFDDSDWRVLAPEETKARLANGRVCFNWYRIAVTVPERIGDLDPTGATLVFEIVVDDYAEIWVDGALPLALGDTGGHVVGGFNSPNRVVLTQDAKPGQRFQVAVFGINGPISASPANYIWMRSATLDIFVADRARVAEEAALHVERSDPGIDDILPDPRMERVAGGFEFTEGPVWTRDGALLFSSPNTNAIYRLTAEGRVAVFRPKSGYTGVDIGRYHERPRLPVRRDALLHRPAVRPPGRLRRPGQGTRLQRRLQRARRTYLPRDRRARGPKWSRVLAGRALPLRRQLGSRPEGRHALPDRRVRRRRARGRLLRHDRRRW